MCDSCKKVVSKEEARKIALEVSSVKSIVFGELSVAKRTRDCCPECYEKIKGMFPGEIHLCDTCEYCPAECNGNNIIFGNGVGNDNVIACEGHKENETKI